MLIRVARLGVAIPRQEDIRSKNWAGYKVSSMPAWLTYQDHLKQKVKSGDVVQW